MEVLKPRERTRWRGLRRLPSLCRARPLRSAACSVLLLLSGAWGSALSPQTLPEDQIKAGFLFNFTRFVEWPGGAALQSAYVLCILEDVPLADLLTESTSGKLVNGRAVMIRRVKPADDLRGCNILFVGGTEERHAKHILQSVQGANVLTVGESPDFIPQGGIFNFSVEDNKVKLDLDLDSANRAGLKISTKLIAVSRRVAGNAAGSN